MGLEGLVGLLGRSVLRVLSVLLVRWAQALPEVPVAHEGPCGAGRTHDGWAPGDAGRCPCA